MRVKRIIVGILIGAAIGAGLECLNTFFTFLLPPFFVLLPLAILIGGCVGALVKGTKDDRFLGETQNLEHLPAGAVEFIKRVLKKMRYRREVRQEVQAELAAHFEDELKDCTTDEQRRQRAEQLITGFGDVKLLAVLLRRAKKRCRPLWRTVVARTFQAVGVLILCFIIYVAWFLTGKPAITTNYVAEFNKIVRPAADESLNAAPLYLKAVDLHKELSDDFLLFFAKNHQAVVDEKNQHHVKKLASKINELLSNKKLWNYQEERQNIQDEVSMLSQFMGKKYNELTVEQRNIAKRCIQEHNDALELVIGGSRRPYHWQTYKSNDDNPGEMISVIVPKLSGLRKLAHALPWRARIRAEQGRFKDAFEDVKSCYRFGQHIRGDKALAEQLVGISIEALSVRTIRDIVGGYEIDSAVLADFQRDFQHIIADENFAISFKAERLIMYDEIQRCFTSDRFGKGHLYLPRFRKISDMADGYGNEGDVGDLIVAVLYSAPYLFGHPNKEETLKSANALYDYFEQLSLKTAVQRHAESDAIDNKFKEIVNGNVFLRTLTPAMGRVIEIGDRVPTDVGAALTMIAIFRYNRDTGRYPQNLNQLVTDGYLKQLPIDSFADKPLVYKKTEDNFILYSVGPDFKDDDGVSAKDSKGRVRPWRDNGDTVFWPLPKPQVK